MKNDSLEIEDGATDLASILTNCEKESSVSKGTNPSSDGNITISSSILTETIQFIKNTLISISNVNHLSMEKNEDVEFKKYCRKSISQDIKKIDSVLNTLLNYIDINTPIIKKNTIHIILEDILEANEKLIRTKNIKVVKKFEKDLPETFIHDEHVRFILNSILQYAIFSTSSNGSIGFLTKSINQKGPGEDKIISLKDRKYIEILIVSSSHTDPFEPIEGAPKLPEVEDEKTIGLILGLIKELIQKSQGMIEFAVDEKKSRKLFFLRLPAERRQVIYYEPIKL